MLHRTLIVFSAAVAIGCVPMATTALAAHGHGGHGGGGHAMAAHAGGGHVARYGGGGYRGARYGGGYYGGGPIYNSCAGYGYGYGYGYGGCPGYGIPLVGGVINGVLGGYGPY